MNFTRFTRKQRITSFVLMIAVAATGFYFFTGKTVLADNNYFAISTGTPFTQNWTNTGLITANDDWSGVPSINGFRGDGLAAATAVDPQTILVADSPGVPDVNANQTNPNTFNTGGVTEFDTIADPVVAIFGSATARAPYIDIRINSSACVAPSNVRVNYNLRDIDGSADNSVQAVALHYRPSNAGAYTNVPSGFVADASTGPSIATLVTPVSATLPADARAQPNLHIRIMTSDAANADEAIGIDDINISCVVASAANASLGGRVLTANGRAISKAWVEISGGTLTQPMRVMTNPFGYYNFSDLAAGQTYTVSVASKGNAFTQPTRIINLGDDLTDVDFSTIE